MGCRFSAGGADGLDEQGQPEPDDTKVAESLGAYCEGVAEFLSGELAQLCGRCFAPEEGRAFQRHVRELREGRLQRAQSRDGELLPVARCAFDHMRGRQGDWLSARSTGRLLFSYLAEADAYEIPALRYKLRLIDEYADAPEEDIDEGTMSSMASELSWLLEERGRVYAEDLELRQLRHNEVLRVLIKGKTTGPKGGLGWKDFLSVFSLASPFQSTILQALLTPEELPFEDYASSDEGEPKRELSKDEAATKIQTMFRGRQARKEAEERRREKEKRWEADMATLSSPMLVIGAD